MDKQDNKLPCHEKMVFDTREQAEAAAVAADWQRGAALKAYQCKYCKLWHLTSA